MPECTRCRTDLEAQGGLLDTVGLAAYDGYECESCGTLLCSECFRDRAVELAGTAQETCPTCEGRLTKR